MDLYEAFECEARVRVSGHEEASLFSEGVYCVDGDVTVPELIAWQPPEYTCSLGSRSSIGNFPVSAVFRPQVASFDHRRAFSMRLRPAKRFTRSLPRRNRC